MKNFTWILCMLYNLEARHTVISCKIFPFGGYLFNCLAIELND